MIKVMNGDKEKTSLNQEDNVFDEKNEEKNCNDNIINKDIEIKNQILKLK